ncbi:integrase core domain-containing protein [Trichomonas vaginalis G3]|uniref:integrase core domain-containing protein n=2 Tax=Trichomonas vaginalis (strain ATCC PRA-98 / G3) TaxID=412133 RepID=UPI0021E614B1|nr:integrase core domain-containing protein [Trichomonas vaginalis G3]KAI5509675.1 integrase core domain-containing protein [Trichomonas vaginalis G3]
MKDGLLPVMSSTQDWFQNVRRDKPLNLISKEIPADINQDDNPTPYAINLQNIKYLPLPLPQAPSRHMVEKAFIILGLTRPRGPKRPKGRTRYEALLPNQIWHVDIHFLNKRRSELLYGVIDDCTRMVLEWQHLSSKHANQTVKVIERAIKRFGPPHTIWSDNGGENRGEFLQAMRCKGIRNVYIVPHCPYQNGKIERLWPNIENRNLTWSKIQSWVNSYNSKPHAALPTRLLNGRKINYSPNELWMKGPIWRPGIPVKWVVDGVTQDFLPGSVQAREIPELQDEEEEIDNKDGKKEKEGQSEEYEGGYEEEYEINYEEDNDE